MQPPIPEPRPPESWPLRVFLELILGGGALRVSYGKSSGAGQEVDEQAVGSFWLIPETHVTRVFDDFKRRVRDQPGSALAMVEREYAIVVAPHNTRLRGRRPKFLV